MDLCWIKFLSRTCLYHSVRCDILMIIVWRLIWRHTSSFGLLCGISLWLLLWRWLRLLLSRTSISEDAHNKEIDRKHDNGTLDANHDLLPGELNLTCNPCKDRNHIIINVIMFWVKQRLKKTKKTTTLNYVCKCCYQNEGSDGNPKGYCALK